MKVRNASTKIRVARLGVLRRSVLSVTAAAVALCSGIPTPADATEQVVPVGTIVSKANINEYRQYVSPGIEWIIDHDATLRVGAYKHIEHPPPFREATEKYSAQVKLAEDGTHLIDHIAGMPFPVVDPNDPWAATKHMFNFNAAIAVDDLDLRNFDCDTGSIGSGGDPLRVERHFFIEHLRRLYFRERLIIDPKPEMQSDDGSRYKEALYPFIEPFDLKGTGFTSNRYQDHTRQDDSWGQDTDQDSYAGYAGNVAWMEWKYLGEKTVLASFHSENLPVKWLPPSGNFMHDDLWEPRDVWVVEGISKLPQYAYSKRVILLDKDIYRIPYTDIYDQGGELWNVWVNNYKIAHKPMPNAKYGFDYDVTYNPSITMVDMQLVHATHCALPSARVDSEQGWYVNLGEEAGTTPEYFALSNIIAAGR